MKIRTDFVTNSSSSNFIAWVELTFDNGKCLRLMGQDEWEGGEGDIIETPKTHYDLGHLDGAFLKRISKMNIQELISMLEKKLSSNREVRALFAKEKADLFQDAHHIKSGKLMLWTHTFGEYFNNANPKNMLEDNNLFDFSGFSFPQDYQAAYQELCTKPDAAYYTEDALKAIAKILTAKRDDHGAETSIIQRLRPDGLLDINVETGDGGIIPLESTWNMKSANKEERKGKYDIKKRMKKYGLTTDEIWKDVKELSQKYQAFLSKPQTIQFKDKSFYLCGSKYGKLSGAYWEIGKMGGTITDTLDSYPDYLIYDIEENASLYSISELFDQLAAGVALCEQTPSVKLIACEKLIEEIERQTPLYLKHFYDGIINQDTMIVFQGQSFVFGDFDDNEDEFQCHEKIISLGGTIYASVRKTMDYLVLGSKRYWNSLIIEKVLALQEEGSNVKIVTIDAIKKALENEYLITSNDAANSVELKTQYDRFIKPNPVITFRYRKFVFTGFPVDKSQIRTLPIVQEVIRRSGIICTSVSGTTDYLVIESISSAGPSKLEKAITYMLSGKSIQIITEKQLMDALQETGIENNSEW